MSRVLELGDTTLVVSEIVGWRLDPAYPRNPDEDDSITIVWLRSCHLTFPIRGDHRAALTKALTEEGGP